MCNTAYKMKWMSKFRVYFTQRKKRIGDESNQALCFSPEKRWNLLLLIISLLQHSVSGYNISPALLGWNHCPPPAPSSATINSSSPVPALPGLSHESSASLCLLWAAPGGKGDQISYRNSQSLTQNQHRILVCWFWYTRGRLAWFVRNELPHSCLGEGRWMCLYLNGIEHKATSPWSCKLCWAPNHFRIQSGAPDPSFRFILEGKEWCFLEVSHFSISHWPFGC